VLKTINSNRVRWENVMPSIIGFSFVDQFAQARVNLLEIQALPAIINLGKIKVEDGLLRCSRCLRVLLLLSPRWLF
jgi:hypothetical protein